MEQSFAQLISASGCYMTRSGAAHIQHETQSFIPYSVHMVDTARRSVVQSILRAEKLDRALKAKIACFLFRALTAPQWHRVAMVGVDKVVKQYAEAVRANATLHVGALHALIKSHEQEL